MVPLLLQLLLPMASASAAPVVAVEEGGRVELPCDFAAGAVCRIASENDIVHISFARSPHSNSADSKNYIMIEDDDEGEGGDDLGKVTGDWSVPAEAFNSTHCVCTLPPELEEAHTAVVHPVPEPGSRDFDDHRDERQVALFKPSLARKPYLSSDSTAEVVVSVDDSVVDAAVRVLSEDGENLCDWTSVPSGADSLVSFSLDSLPSVTEAKVEVQVRHNSKEASKILFLSRVPPPPKSIGTFVQVDYTRRSLLVNGELLMGSGYYDSQTESRENMTRLGRAGLTWTMKYFTSNAMGGKYKRKSDRFTQNYLDWAHESGMYVMMDLHRECEDFASSWNSTFPRSVIERVIHKFQNHPALLGWYVCDDCVFQYLNRRQRSHTGQGKTIRDIYLWIRELDPWHPVIGAAEGGTNPAAFLTDRLLPGPSLDVVLMEDYVPNLAGNAHAGTPGDKGMDGHIALWPLTWEPVVNCPGPYRVVDREKDLNDDEIAAITYSLYWLSPIVGNMPHLLSFRLFVFHFRPHGYYHLPVYEKIMLQLGRYRRVASHFSDFLLPKPSGRAEPTLVQVEQDTATQEEGSCKQCARLWRRPVEGKPEAFCVLIAVVNTISRDATAHLMLKGAESWPDASKAKLSLVDESGNHSQGDEDEVRFRDGNIRIHLKGRQTLVYVSEDCGPQDSNFLTEAEQFSFDSKVLGTTQNLSVAQALTLGAVAAACLGFTAMRLLSGRHFSAGDLAVAAEHPTQKALLIVAPEHGEASEQDA